MKFQNLKQELVFIFWKEAPNYVYTERFRISRLHSALASLERALLGSVSLADLGAAKLRRKTRTSVPPDRYQGWISTSNPERSEGITFQRFRPTFRKLFLKKNFFDSFNGWLYRQGRELAGKATRRRIRRWGRLPESVGKARTCPVHGC